MAITLDGTTGITASGNITGSYILGNGSQLTGIDATSIQNGTSNVRALASGNVTVSSAGVANVAIFTSTGANITGTLNATGNANVGNLGTAGLITATGNITGGNLSGTSIVGTLTTAAQTNITSVGTLGALTVTGNVSGGNLTTGGLISATGNITGGNLSGTNISGTLTTASQTNITSVGTLGALTVTGNISGGNLLINTNAVITGNLTVNGTETIFNVANLTVNDKDIIVANNVTGGANVNGAGLQAGNPATATWFFNNATTSWQSNVGITPTANGTLALGGTSNYWGAAYVTTIIATGNANVGNLGATSIVGTLTTASQTNITSVGTLGSLTVTANVAGGNLTTTGQVTATGNVSGGNLNVTGNIVDTGALSIITAASGNVSLAPNGTNVLIATTTGANITGTLNATGNANVGNLGTSGNISASYFLGNGSQLTGIDATAIQNGSANVRAFLNGNVTVSAAGTANVLVVTSTGANIAGTLNTGTGNANVGNLGAATVAATTLTGTLSTAAQTNITSVGTLGSLAVTGNITSGNLSGTSIVGTLTTAAQPNITSVGTLGSLAVTGNVSGGNLNVTGNIVDTGALSLITAASGNVSLAPNGTNVLVATTTGANITGTLNATGNANVGNLGAATVAATTLTGTLSTAAQTNITSVGTLGALAVTGNITSGNLSGTSIVGTLITAAQTNITSVGTLGALAVTGNASSATAAADTNTTQLATTAYVIGQASATTPTTIGTNTIGTSLRYARADHTHTGVSSAVASTGISVSGATGAVTFTNTGVTSAVAGTNISVSGATGAVTIAVTGTVPTATTAGTVTTAAQANITSVGTLTSLAVTGAITGGSLGVSTGNITGGNLILSGAIEDSAQLDIRTTASNGNIVLTPNGTGVILAVKDIVNGQANGVGNIGSAVAYFNTVFAKATSAQYADLAESYTADADYYPGTVVSFGGTQEVTISNTDSDRRIAGVVSTNPSYIMNSGLESDHVSIVALQGRVPTKVTGKVSKGDLMVSAGNGRARAEQDPKLGAVIGKALEDFDGDTGVIEVVVGRI